jgi:type IV pilus assembly protein PilM
MPSTDLILAIDIGADTLKMAEFSYPPSGGVALEKFACTEFGGELKEEELMAAMKEAMASSFAENNFTAKKVLLSISGQAAFIRFVKLPPIGEEEHRVRQVVEYEAKQNVPFPIEQVVWDYQLIGGGESETEIEVMFVVVKGDYIQEITDTLENLGKQTILVDVAPTACYNAARANEIGANESVMILNIGGRSSSLVFIDSGRFFVRSIPIAGHTITQQISKEFGIPFADAEELKRRHGFVALGGAYEEPDSEVAATVSKIVRNVMTRLHGEINRSINVYRSQQKGEKPTKLYLAGGSSVMAFTPRFFQEKLKIPVEYLNPFQVVSLSKVVDRESLAEVAHMFSEVIGLGLRHATTCPIEISLVPPELRRLQEIRQKSPYFYASAASFLLCLFIALGAITRQEQIDRKKAEMASALRDRTRRMDEQIASEERQKRRQQVEYDQAVKILNRRTTWFEVINEIQTLLPDKMWLTSIKPTDAPTAETAGEEESGSGGGGTPGGIFPMFRRNQRTTETKVTTAVEWLEIKGHALVGTETNPIEGVFKQNIVASKVFEAKETDDVKTIAYTAVQGKDNITSFTMRLKLKTPIQR